MEWIKWVILVASFIFTLGGLIIFYLSYRHDMRLLEEVYNKRLSEWGFKEN